MAMEPPGASPGAPLGRAAGAAPETWTGCWRRWSWVARMGGPGWDAYSQIIWQRIGDSNGFKHQQKDIISMDLNGK